MAPGHSRCQTACSAAATQRDLVLGETVVNNAQGPLPENMPSADSAAAHKTAHERSPAPVRSRTLRIALAMRGGVSLAIWIGGAVAELDLFRRACNSPALTDPRCDVYRALLEKTEKYRRVEMDILAGASAGGLNAVLFGVAQTCGAVMDDVAHKTWVTDGGMWELLRDRGFGRVASLLAGDERFFVVMREALRDIAAQGQSGIRVRRLSVELAATLLTDATKGDRANRARFSFVASAGTLSTRYCTIPNADEAKVAGGRVALDRLALAARATSSFPGAFEPSSVYSARSDAAHEAPADFGVEPAYFLATGSRLVARGNAIEERPKEDEDCLGVNMSPAFPYAHLLDSGQERDIKAGPPEPFYVVDGGIFDNIPIDRALRAIKQAPAAAPSERFLIYLDPEPPTATDAGTDFSWRDSALNWLPVIQRSLSLKQRAETADDELDLILEHNHAVLQNRGRLEALAEQLRTNPPADADFIDDATYVQCRIASDAARLVSLLTDPWAEICQPPHLGAAYVALEPAEALMIKNQVAAVYNETEGLGEFLSRDVQALADQVRVLLAWTRAMEDLLDVLVDLDPRPESAVMRTRVRAAVQLRGWKRTGYRWLTVLAAARFRAVQRVMAEPLRGRDRGTGLLPVARYPMAAQLRESWLRQEELELTPRLVELLSAPGRPADDRNFYRYLSASRQFESGVGQRLSVIADGDRSPGSAPGVLENIRIAIAECMAPVVSALPTAIDPESPLRGWTESVYALFHTGVLSEARIDQIARLFAVTEIPDTASIINFDKITSAEMVTGDISVLADAARAKHVRQWLNRSPNEVGGQSIQDTLDLLPNELVTADAKLAGNALNRFGGFALTEWRRNDWQWGRLDAAAGIARILHGVAPVKEPECRVDEDLEQARERIAEARANELENTITELHDSIRSEAGDDVDSRGDPLTRTVGAQTLEAISPNYRFALASRLVPLMYRAVAPAESASTPTKAAAWLVQMLAMRPAAVPVPLCADPLRAMLGTALVLFGAAMLGVSDSPRPLHIVYCVVLLALGIVFAVRVGRLHAGWRAVRACVNDLDGSYPDWEKILQRSNRPAYGALGALLALTVIALAVVHFVCVVVHWGTGQSATPEYGAMPFEPLAAVVALAIAGHWWLYRESARVIPVESVPVRGTPARVLAAVGGISLLVLTASTALVPRMHGVDGMGGAVLGLLGHCAPGWWYASVAGVTAGALTALSLWGWARNRCVAICTALVGAAAVLLQSTFDVWWRITSCRPILDLLPTVTWMVLLGAVLSMIPFRITDYGDRGAVPRTPARDSSRPNHQTASVSASEQ